MLVRASAHDTWLEPERFTATPGVRLSFGLTSGDGFNGAETAIKPERVARALARLIGQPVDVILGAAGERMLGFSATLPRPGVAVFGVELKPRLLELEPGKIEPYLREIHASESLRAAWAALPEPKRWRETYVKHAKTFVRIGEPAAGDRSWAQPLGLGLEVVPERDPTALGVGDTFAVRVLHAGEPLAGFVVGFVSAGETREHVVVTDGEGRAAAPLDVPGLWLVHGTFLRRATAAEREWDSDFTTLVVDVKDRGSRAAPDHK